MTEYDPSNLPTRSPPQSEGYSPTERNAKTSAIAKALGLVRPSNMSEEGARLFIASALETLEGISAAEIEVVILEVRRAVTRPAQIVPEICRLVSERRKSHRQSREYDTLALPGPPVKRDVMDRRGQPMSQEDTDELNKRLEWSGATARYRVDGSRYLVEKTQ